MKEMVINLLPKNLYLALKRWDYKRSYTNNFAKLQSMRSEVTEKGYSYQGFDDKKAIFVHIPKCAGVSISKTIFGNLAGAHTTLEEYTNIFEPHCINEYFKFTIVRNPWDRLVSAYFFLEQGGYGEEDRAWFNKELSAYTNFDDFVKHWVNKENIWKWSHFRPQYHYMLDKRQKVPLDFVGYFENLDNDFNYITKQIGLNCKLPNTNKSTHNNYQDYYTEETKQIVKEAYLDDIALLGYSFDNSSLQDQLTRRTAQ